MRTKQYKRLLAGLLLTSVLMSQLQSETLISLAKEASLDESFVALETKETIESLQVEQMIQSLDETVITSFDSLDTSFYEYEYKPWLGVIRNDLPKELSVTLGGEFGLDSSGNPVFINGTTQLIDVQWECLQDYDDTLGTYEFSPITEGYTFFSGIDIPVVTVHIKNENNNRVTLPDQSMESIELHDSPQSISDSEICRATPLPEKYNGYEQGNYLPPVRDQGMYATCWAFAALGAIEANLIKNNLNDRDYQLSPYALAYFVHNQNNDPKNLHNNDISVPNSSFLDIGGNSYWAIRTINNKLGAVKEELFPYEASAENEIEPDEAYVMENDEIRLKNVYYINSSYQNRIKEAILSHGSVVASMNITLGESSKNDITYTGDYSATYNTFSSNSPYQNHEVMLVGWDDSFPKEYFPLENKPESDGAWLVRNSYGLDDYGLYGYFWISYEELSLIKTGVTFAIDADHDCYDNVYSYDGFPCISSRYTKYPDEENEDVFPEMLLTQTFPVDANEEIKALSIETYSDGLSFEITLSGESKTIHQTFTTDDSGYYLFEFDDSIKTRKKENLDLTMKITSSPRDPIIDMLFEYSAKDIVLNSITYSATKGSNATVDGEIAEGDPRIRLYTNNYNPAEDVEEPEEVEEVILQAKNSYIYDYCSTTVPISLEDDSVNIQDFTWTSENEDIATVSEDGIITIGSSKGSTQVCGYYPRKNAKVFITVEVKPYQIHYDLDDDVFVTSDLITEYYPNYSGNQLTGTYSCYKKGYSMNGFCLDPDNPERLYASDLANQTGDITLYCIWKDKRFDVSFYDQNNSLINYKYVSLPYKPLEDDNLNSLFSYYTKKLLGEETNSSIEVAYLTRNKEGTEFADKITLDEFDYEKTVSSYGQVSYKETPNQITLYPFFKKKVDGKGILVDSLTLGLYGKIELKFVLDLSNYSDEQKQAMEFILQTEKNDVTYRIEDATLYTDSNGNTRYGFSYPLVAAEMDQPVSLFIKDTNVSTIDLHYAIENGNLLYQTGYNTSILDYLKSIEKNEIPEAVQIKDITRAMAFYGYYSKVYFNPDKTYDMDQYLNQIFNGTDYSDFLDEITNVKPDDLKNYSSVRKIGKQNSGIRYYGTSLLLKSGTTIRHYFNIEEGKSPDDFLFTCDGKTLVPTMKDNLCYVDIENISAVDYNKAYVIQVNDYELHYSVYSYLYNVLNRGNSSPDLENIAKAMYLFGESSRKYYEN